MFVLHLLADPGFNATKAAHKAGYKNPRKSSQQLMDHPVIKAAVGREIGDRAHRLKLDADDVLLQLKSALKIKPLVDLFDKGDDGHLILKDRDDIPDSIHEVIEEVKERTKYTKDGDKIVELEIRTMNKTAMMGLIMKHLGLLEKPEEEQERRMDEEVVRFLLDEVENRSNIIDAEVIERKVTDGNQRLLEGSEGTNGQDSLS
jgi:hypothetical protein